MACRFVATLQNNMPLDISCISRLNKEEKLPHFNDVFYQFKINYEEDEFVDIEEDQIEQKVNHSHENNNKFIEQKKNLDDLLSFLPENENMDNNNYNHNNNDFSSTTQNFNLINQVTVNNNLSQTLDDEFVNIEEGEPKEKNNYKIKEDSYNQLQVDVPNIPKELNFNDLIFNPSPHQHINKEQIENNFTFNNEMTNDIPKPKVSLDDLFTNIDFNTNSDNLENLENKNIIDYTETNFKLHSESKNNQEDDLEFCEVEEKVNSLIEDKNEDLFAMNVLEDNNNNIDLLQVIQNVQEPSLPIYSIINYTPDDFLNEFKRDNKKTENEDDGFDFVEDITTNNLDNSKIENILPESTIQLIFKNKLKEESIISKFKCNLERIVENLNKEISNIYGKLNEIKECISKNNFDKNIINNNRQLTNYLNAIINFLLLEKRINSLIAELEKEERLKFSLTNNHLLDLISIPEFESIIENSQLEKLKNYFPKINYKNNSDKICHICLNNLEEEINTNVFSNDFHISCINFWLNLVDNKSPFSF